MKDSVFVDNQPTAAHPSHLPAAVSELPQLTFNILAFSHPEQTREFTFSANGNACEHRFHINKLPSEAMRLFPGLDPLKPFVYTNFDNISEGISIKIDFNKQRAVARAWYTLKIRNFLRAYANVTVTNFLNDCQFWFVEKDINNSLYHIYKKFTIRVQNDHRSGTPELLVSFDGKSYALKSSLAQLTKDSAFDTRHLKSVLYRKQVYLYDSIPNEALYHPDEIFPLISRANMSAFGVNLPSVINRQKYLSVYNEILGFYSEYLQTNEFRAIIPHTGKWKPAINGDVSRLKHTARNVDFGQGFSGADIFAGLKVNGPYRLPEYKHFKIFMIYQENDLEAALKLKEYVVKTAGFGSLGAFTRLPVEYDKNLDIILNGDNNPVEVIHDIMQTRSTDPDCGYFAFYISPYTRFETLPANRGIYYKIKEIMLRRGIGLQVIERNKIGGNFAYSIANIGIAMIAKMGGIPWRLSRTEEKELIIGFGAFTSQLFDTKYVASALCFSNDGSFQEFDCFPADETWSIAALVKEALIAYRRKNTDVKRIVIHFYQKIGRKQLKPIEDMLLRLEFDIPVVVIRINKTFSQSQLAFDEASSGKMPLNGSFVHIGRQEYLFCNNQRENSGSVPSALPLPLKIGLQSTREGLLDDPALVERLMMQIYEFSFMHWRSVNQQNLPVTVTYPEMLARLFPWFDSETLSDEGRRSLFFL